MATKRFLRLPKHVGIIPDGNRRWAKENGLPVTEGYSAGALKGLEMLQDCEDLGIKEVSLYGFTQDNTKRPREQRIAFAKACVDFAYAAIKHPISLLVVGDVESPMFPEELKRFTGEPHGRGLKVNMLVNYGWEWDLNAGLDSAEPRWQDRLASARISRMDMIVRWGGCRRLSGFLPIQSVYADFFVVNGMWPNYELDQFHDALQWYQTQEASLGG